MSSILKALRKLEEQQAARRGPGGVPPTRPAPTGPAWRAPAVVLGAVVLAVLATVAVMNGRSGRTVTAEAVRPPGRPVPANGASVTAAEPATPVAAPTAGADPVPAADPTEEPARPAPRAAATARTRTAPPLPSLQEPGSASFSAAARPAAAPAATRTVAEARPVDRALAPPPAPPALVVSGIAWHKGEGERIAMVNGAPVSEGTVVAGARVVEIKPDRVRFSRDGAAFEVPLGTGGER